MIVPPRNHRKQLKLTGKSTNSSQHIRIKCCYRTLLLHFPIFSFFLAFKYCLQVLNDFLSRIIIFTSWLLASTELDFMTHADS
uniref:Uncharacterized protein n=1 Tax=Lotus japonicus TaxID=34305 RepID=I3SCR6_LOTJA|nr:unknown [Lotus japonicus]